MKKLIVVGNGMVGLKLCQKLRDRAGPDVLEIEVFGEEPRPAYDRVHLSSYFEGAGAEALELAPRSWYSDNGICLNTGEAVTDIDRAARNVFTSSGGVAEYDELVLATGSSAFVPPALEGLRVPGIFVYRTVEDLETIEAYAQGCRTGAVLGGGLLGLEAAGALLQMGLETAVIEYMPRLMPRQLDDRGASCLRRLIEKKGIEVLIGKDTRGVRGGGPSGRDSITAIEFADQSVLPTDMLVISTGIRPRDELARACGLEVGENGGIVVDDRLRTSDERIYAIGEVALHKGTIYGLVGPGYQMAEVAASQIAGPLGDHVSLFQGADTSTRLKLVGVEVASFGDALGSPDGADLPIAYENPLEGVYKRINVAADGSKLTGGILVGETSEYGLLQQLSTGALRCPANPADLILGKRAGAEMAAGVAALPAEAQVCSCENVSKGAITCAITEQDATDLSRIARLTKAGTGCGGCKPLVTDLIRLQLESMGRSVSRVLCEHFEYTRQELFDIIRVRRIRSYDALLDEYGGGDGCEVCKPAVASIIASVFAEIATTQETIQDTNDRFLANIQRGGTYSVVPRVPGGEITPQKLKAIGEVAEKYDLYTKITGGQRIDLFGARVEQLPSIWEELIAAGFESGHAYGKALRTVKSCVGTSWCRYGVQDSVGFAIRIENRYKGLRAPHKIKSAVSGCIRECAEAQSKDFGVIATEKGWNLYVCGNGGAKPQHAQLLATDIDDDTCIRLIDRFLMYYIRTAEPLTRTAKWLNQLDGGLEHLRDVIVHDSLGLCDELERDMEALVQGYECEWKAVVENPELRRRFAPFVNVDEPDPGVRFVRVRDQKQPEPWPKSEPWRA